MGKTLLIAEKPSVGKDLAAYLGIISRGKGFFTCKNDIICTWCIGHILEQADPDCYDPKYKKWRAEDLPIIPEKWILEPIPRTREQLQTIKNLLKDTTAVINAGDPEREGQLIVDEVLDFLGYEGPAKRLWISALDIRTIKKGFANLKDNKEYQNIKNAAICRSNADWLVGINVTRGLTLAACQPETVLSAGRVQTPTLSLVVDRDREIENFQKKPFWILRANIDHPNGSFIATWNPNELSAGLDAEGRLINEGVGDEIINKMQGASGLVTARKNDLKSKKPPLPFLLSDLQKKAEDKFGYSPKETLEIGQGLYEKHKVLTYMRTECRYLPNEMFEDAPSIIECLKKQGIEGAADADITIESPAWNTKKQGAEAHHGIIPTEVMPGHLSIEENNIYQLVARRFLKQFYPDYQYYSSSVEIEAEGEKWNGNGILLKELGWMVLNDQQTKDKLLPTMAKGDAVSFAGVEKEQKFTKPPSRFTEASLQVAMTEVHKFVDDPVIKARLKENSGIGTSATRTNIITELQNRNYLEKSGKTLISTARGRELIDKIHPSLKNPGMTAIWEDALNRICEGELGKTEFLTELTKRMSNMVKYALATRFSENVMGKVYRCLCGGYLSRLESKNKKGKYFWVCSKGQENGCPLRSDFNGAPGAAFMDRPESGPPCPHCEKGYLIRFESNRKMGHYFWACSTGKKGKCPLLRDENGAPGKPVIDPKAPQAPCPEKGCKKKVTLIQSQNNKDFYFWKCSDPSHPLRKNDNGKPGDIIVFSSK
ncbi:DNA topoisomerase 3 [Desulforhopalus sp. IMCC35007]|uniref:DNA topoisomerase 3 n=1 Tax=Desulforhopalus sp. IMCC35007 TaxID=2569543 RepID=UPI0010ADB783|nr:DNA topoisomerase 3 [Desulforhopalus sp. IMCC35007]TKB06695.1 DNA topoisomerase III [Desulforhopalus sp. IMCC35007]